MKYAYMNGILLDGREAMEPQHGKTILVKGGRIETITEGPAPRGYKHIDLNGNYIMPGLINLHVHLPASGKPKNQASDARKLVRLLKSTALTRELGRQITLSSARTELLSGVTTIRSVGGFINADTSVRDRINSGRVLGPRILAGNMAISVPDGHMAGSLAYEAHSAEEARELVRTIAVDKPDLIKLMITGGVLDAKVRGEPGELKMPPELVRAACDEAHKLGFQVAAHVESPLGVRVALENGVDTIEHGAKPDEEILRLFRERKAAHVATFSPAVPLALFPREISGATETEQFNTQVVFDGVVDCAKACLAEGIPVGLGTDTGCPYITHYNMWRELDYFQRYCGVTRAFALYTATLGNARIVRIDHETGSIEPGKSADFVVTEKNPLEDLRALEKISAVTIRGRYIDQPKVKKSEKVENPLDLYY